MDKILEIDKENLVAVVQPGVINAALKAAVAAEGLFYPPDPASFEMCSIGGNLGTNAGGLCCVKYGQTRDSVLSLEVVMADGTILRTGGRNIKDVAGYSLTHLFVGSQGTLAITTEATLKLRPAPPPRLTMLAFFPTLESAGDAVAGIAAAGPRAGHARAPRPVHDRRRRRHERPRARPDAAAMLMIESDMPGVAATDELERAEAACRAAGATDMVRAADAQEADWLRQARRAAHYALERLGDVRMEDVGVPRSRVPDMLRAIEAIAAKHDVRIGTFGHAGDGNLHPDMVFERGDPNAEAKVEAVKKDLYQAAIDLGGTVTGEHGIGSARREWLEVQKGADAVRVMRAIKAALDPLGHPQPGARPLAARSSARRRGPYQWTWSFGRAVCSCPLPSCWRSRPARRRRRLAAADAARRPRSPSSADRPPRARARRRAATRRPPAADAPDLADGRPDRGARGGHRRQTRRRRLAARPRVRPPPAHPRDRRPEPVRPGRGRLRRRPDGCPRTTPWSWSGSAASSSASTSSLTR